jgi:hypothetical protein
MAGDVPLPARIATIHSLATTDLAEAERLARTAAHDFPRSRDAELALANVLLWRGKYREAREHYRALLARNPGDGDARLGLAQSLYWSGDYRGAVREFRRAGARAEARRALAEIEAASRPGFAIAAGALDDDQPYRMREAGVSLFAFSDPLTKWQLDLGTADRNRKSTPLLRAGVETAIEGVRLQAALGRMRFPDGSRRLLPRFGAARGNVELLVERREWLRSASALRTHATADIVSLRWSRGERSAVHAERIRYFDHNRGVAADAFWLRPVGRFSLGAAAAFRDTDQSRFDGGTYVPYYTPQQLREVRLVASAAMRRGAATFGVHLDAGAGHERVVGTFHPWRATASLGLGLPHGTTLAVEAAASATAFYESHEIHASLAGRF